MRLPRKLKKRLKKADLYRAIKVLSKIIERNGLHNDSSSVESCS